MGNQKKSTCQLRLEARSRAYKQQETSAPLSAFAAAETLSTNEHLAEQMHSRIARATEVRVSTQRARKNRARERVLHAQRVAREQHAKRREQRSSVYVASREKVEVARERRRAQIEQLQQLCKSRVAHVREKVQIVKDGQRRRSETARSELQTQLVEAARRREEQTQRMVRRLSQRWQSVESVKDRVARVKFIQRWYRRHVDARKTAASLRAVASDVARVVQCWQQIAGNGFEASMVLLQDRALARSAQSVLRVLLPSAANQSPGGKTSPKSGASYRVLLMAGMLAFHPSEIMETGQCDRLAFAARGMYSDMLRIFVLLESGTARELKTCVARLEAHFAFYFASFSRWKNRDAERLATEMLRSYHDIYEMKKRYEAKQPAHEGDGAHEWVFQTERQLTQLKSALAQVIGKDETLARVEAVERSVDQRDEQMSSSASSAGSDAADDTDEQPPGSPSGEAAAERLESEEQPLPPQLESFLADELLVHELIMNPELKLPLEGAEDAGSTPTLATRVRETMRQAFWDQVVAANDIPALLARTEELRLVFASVVSMRRELVDDVNTALASAALEALMQTPNASIRELKTRCLRVVRAILQAEAPARNAATHAFVDAFERNVAAYEAAPSAAPTHAVRLLVDFLAFALEKVDAIRADLVNVHMRLLATYLQRHGVAYEQTKLHAQLAAGARFDKTHQWLAAEMPAYWATLATEERDAMARYDSHAFAKFLRHCMLALVTTHIEGASGVWPESFRMDVARVRGFRDTIDRITVVSSLLVVLQEYAARRRLVAPPSLYRRIGQELSALLQSAGISGAHLVDRAVDEMRQLEAKRAVSPSDPDDELRALAQRLQSAFSPSNPVFRLFGARVMSAISAAQFDQELDVHTSLAPFADEIRALALAIKRLARHNESVHAALYNSIVKQLVAAM